MTEPTLAHHLHTHTQCMCVVRRCVYKNIYIYCTFVCCVYLGGLALG